MRAVSREPIDSVQLWLNPAGCATAERVLLVEDILEVHHEIVRPRRTESFTTWEGTFPDSASQRPGAYTATSFRVGTESGRSLNLILVPGPTDPQCVPEPSGLVLLLAGLVALALLSAWRNRQRAGRGGGGA
jgi:hypothetical protein